MVAVGLTLVDPLGEVEINVPGAMAIVVAPLVTQLSVVLVPEFIVVGLAPNEVIAGTGPPVVLCETVPQPLKLCEASRSKASPKRFAPARFDASRFDPPTRRL